MFRGMKTPEIVATIAELRARIAAWRGADSASAWCPPWARCTRAICRWCATTRSRADKAVVSIFVNPAQFAPHEDFDRYPRDSGGRCRESWASQADLIFAPSVEEMYPDGFATKIEVGGPSAGTGNRFPAAFLCRRGDRGGQAADRRDARCRDVRREGLPAASGDPPPGRRSRPCRSRLSARRSCARRTVSRCRRATPISSRTNARSRAG